MKRRDFIIRTGIATAGLMMAPGKGFQIINNLPKKIVIIGAGLSGLTAAYELKKAGVNCLLLEGASHIGGRIRTLKLKNACVELGAEWIGFGHSRIRQLCHELNLYLTNHHYSTHLTINNSCCKPGSWVVPDIFANSPYLFSTEGPVSAFSKPNNEMDYKIEGGTTRLINKLASVLGNYQLKLNSRVIAVDRLENTFVLYCTNGMRYKADVVICALPAPLIPIIKWQPSLDKVLLQQLKQTNYQQTVKVPMGFRKKLWKDDDFEMISDQLCSYVYHAQQGLPSNDHMLTFTLSGESAKQFWNASENKRFENLVKTLKPAFGKNVSSAVRSVDYFKGLDASRMISYAMMDFDNIPEFPAVENLHFCGDYLTFNRGFMEASVQSAQEVVLQLLG